MPQNPKWTRDELILGLDLYLRINPLRTTHEDPAILDLSRVLNSLPFHPRSEREATFRNPVGVYMTLRTFLRWDPNYSGKGLEGGSLGKLIWDEFSQDPERLSAIAGLIRKSVLVVSTSISIHGLLDEEDTFPEGKILTALHNLRERNPKVTKKKKGQVLKSTGRLACEICNFDFKRTYGDVGQGFAECHHLRPLGELLNEQPTRIADLAIVCANCHRMLHKARPPLSILELRQTIARLERAKGIKV